jgi:hypothetical protein
MNMEEIVKIDINDVKKDLYKSKVYASFSHYSNGKLYYNVETLGSTYQFPINVTEKVTKTVEVNSLLSVEVENALQLSADLGMTAFGTQIKASELNRWISKAIDTDDFIKIG